VRIVKYGMTLRSCTREGRAMQVEKGENRQQMRVRNYKYTTRNVLRPLQAEIPGS
jgi:hypothetical protein